MRTHMILAALPLALTSAILTPRAPLHAPREGAQVIEGEYVVMFKKSGGASIQSSIQKSLANLAARPSHVYNNIGGFAARLTEKELEELRDNADVAYVEPNIAGELHAIKVQEDAPWGLARLSNLGPGSTTYTYEENGGEGVCAYVIDTGIDVDHPEFEGRVTWVDNVVDNSTIDGYGHGTHVAGTNAGTTFGVAKKAHLYSVKVWDNEGVGSVATMIAGMEVVLEDAPKRDCPNGVTVNMSFGSPAQESVNAAAAALASAGYFTVASAGNNGEDASHNSPASEPSICTVGAMDSEDFRARFSSNGPLVDIHAPGVHVLSAYPGGLSDYMNGTSMSAPHVAGLGAFFMSQGMPADTMCEYLREIALEGVLDNVLDTTDNLLAHNGLAE